jgi:hypothetical protein
MKRIPILIATVILLLLVQTTKAQQGIGTNTPDKSAAVDILSNSRGLLIPRVDLTSTNVAAPILTPVADALMVYNKNTAGDVTPGFYYWSGAPNNKWVRLADKTTNDWHVNGNSGTDEKTNFLGTVDAQNLVFKVGGMQAGLLSDYDGASHRRSTSFGVTALNPATTAYNSTAIGWGALTSNTTGDENTSLGALSMSNNTTGSYNVALGAQSMNTNTTGNGNVAFGHLTLYHNSTGNNNIGIGNQAGTSLTAGDNNIFIGNVVTPNVSTTGSDQLNIGNWIYGDNGKIGVGNGAIIPSERMDIANGNLRVRDIYANIGAGGDRIVTANANGVLRTVTAASLTPATSNLLSSSVNTITSTVNGMAATAPAINSLSNASSVNTATVTVNGVTSTGAPIVNSNTATLAGTTLTNTVNGVAGSVNLQPAITAGTTHTLSSAANTITSVVNGIVVTAPAVNGNTLAISGNTLTSTVNGVAATSNAVSGVSNASAVNTTTVTVNGITSTGAPIVNSNTATLAGTTLTNTVNGVAGSVNLQPAITAGTTHTLSSAANTITSVVNGIVVTAPAVNGNTLAISGNTLTSTVNGVAATSNAVSGVSNASAVNTTTVTVNGITSTGAPIVNSNTATLAGTTLTNTVNGVAGSVNLQPAITAGTTHTLSSAANTITSVVNGIVVTAPAVNGNTLAISGNTLTSTVNGVAATSNAVSGVSNASAVNTATVTVNGVTSTGAPIINSLSNTFTPATALLSTTVNGQTGATVDLSSLKVEPWYIQGGSTQATANDNNIYQTGKVSVGGDNGTGILTVLNTAGTNNSVDFSMIANRASGNPATLNFISNLGTGSFTNLAVAGDKGLVFSTDGDAAVDAANGFLIVPHVSGAKQWGLKITEQGKTSINAATPTESFDVGETMRIRQLPTNGAANAIYNGATTQTTTFTAAKMVVADANGVLGSMPLSPTVTAANGLTMNVNAVELGGTLSKATTIVTNTPAAATLAITGLQPATLTTPPAGGTAMATDNIIVSASGGVLKTVPATSLAIEPWFNQAVVGTQATGNTQNIYQMGGVAIGRNAFFGGTGTAGTPGAGNEMLSVNGSIRTNASVYADYVFEDYFKGKSIIKADYKFKTLKEVDEYIRTNGHLPGISPINGKDVVKTTDGYSFDLTSLSVQSLEKLEELYLHVIEQQKQIEAKNNEIETMKKDAEDMKARLLKLENLLIKK